MEQLARTYGGVWRPGRNPPDAYLTVGSAVIGVEISTLTQHVPDNKGRTKSRYTDDATGLWIINEVKAALRHRVPDGRTVILTVYAPVHNARKTKTRLEEILLAHLAVGKDVDVTEDIYGNSIAIRVSSYHGIDDAKIHGLVPHQKSSPDILFNARYALDDRIMVKAAKCQSIPGPLWLALLNDYWLADDATYQQAFKMQSRAHPFDKILLVAKSGAVVELG
jgi:hypothetical protein